jgi:PAS domain S-box-containing protein
MSNEAPPTRPQWDEQLVLRWLVEGTAAETGENFFAALVKNLAEALGVHGAWATEYFPEIRQLRAFAFWLGGEFVQDYHYAIDDTPCAPVVEDNRLVHIPDQAIKLYPRDLDLKAACALSYLGIPLTDTDGRVLGHLAVLDNKPMPPDPRTLTLLRIFAARAAAELRRLRAESELREREEKLTRLVDSAPDAILELDSNLRVTMMNPAAETVFLCRANAKLGSPLDSLLAPESRETLRKMIRDFDAHPNGRQFFWIPTGLTALRADQHPFPVEATLSRYEVRRERRFSLIFRDATERQEAERRVLELTREAESLREEVRELHGPDDIIGQSPAFLQVLKDLQIVAQTDATVLIQGETGTGKEIIAKAIHRASRRCNKPLVKVNCAAIPATLIESEFFGHEQGAFTGATRKREGRFAVADQGTLFLDEVGELPLDLQAKLLRVLQEGEFEPVGSSKSQKANVRVIAATNRDLRREIREGRFREDLFYRLNVFPLHLPALRDRLEDIEPLARAFVARCAQRFGRRVGPLSPEALRQLKAYDWPGNIRELQNVIERAVIISPDGMLNLDRVLPTDESGRGARGGSDTPSQIRTVQEMRELERGNILAALEASGWRISGTSGAAQMLGLSPSTLSSRMKALGIQRPR